MVPRARGPDLPMPLAPANDRGRNRPLIVGADDARRARRAAVRRAGRRPGHRQGRGRGHHPGAQRHHCRAAASRRPGPSAPPGASWSRWRDWLACWGVTKIGMEATGDYWKPVFFLLESRGFDCQLYNAAQVKALPGRPKTDRADSIWLARITERGIDLLQLRAARADPPPAHPHPLPPAPHPGPHRREAAGGEAARRRAPETVQHDLRHPRRLRPGHAEHAGRRAA